MTEINSTAIQYNLTLGWGISVKTLGAAIGLSILLFANVAVARSSPGTCWMSDNSGCRSFIGKRLWVSIPPGDPNVVEVTFLQHDWTTERTLKLKSGASFVVKDLTTASVGADDYYVMLNDGRRGWVGSATPFLIDDDAVAVRTHADEDCIGRGQPKIGMTAAELIASCWGKPHRIVRKTTTSGIEDNYSIGHIVKFSHGKVSEIIETR